MSEIINVDKHFLIVSVSPAPVVEIDCELVVTLELAVAEGSEFVVFLKFSV